MSDTSGYRLVRLVCDGCKKPTPWQLMPPGLFPHPKGWVLHKHTQLCEPCFMKTVPKKFKEHAHDLGDRVREKRQGLSGLKVATHFGNKSRT